MVQTMDTFKEAPVSDKDVEEELWKGIEIICIVVILGIILGHLFPVLNLLHFTYS